MTQFKLGRLPADPTRPRLRLASSLAGLPPPPSRTDWAPGIDWQMLGNDEWGDCVFASNGHIAEQQTVLGTRLEIAVTTADILTEYARVTGFDPTAGPSGQNPTDKGALVQDGLDDLRKTGLGQFKITAFAELNCANLTEIKQAVARLGAVDLGILVTQAMMDQFTANLPWTTNREPGDVLGGHCVTLVGYDPQFVYLITWGRTQRATWAWWRRYVEEAWAIVSQDWADDGRAADPAGVNLAVLGAEFSLLTGEPNPFPPPPPPPPVPPPLPDPVPVPTPFPPPDAPPTLRLKAVVREEPAVLAWALDGGLVTLTAVTFHLTRSEEAAAAVILSAMATIATALQTRPANISLMTGALTTIIVAAGAFGLHLSANNIALGSAALAAVLSLLFRGQLTPRFRAGAGAGAGKPPE